MRTSEIFDQRILCACSERRDRNDWGVSKFVILNFFVNFFLLVSSVMRAKKAWTGFAFIIVLRLWRVFRLIFLLIAFKEEFYELIEDGPKPAENEETAAEIEAGEIEEKQK